MDNNLKTQLENVDEKSNDIKCRENKELENKLSIIRGYLLTLIKPNEFSDIAKENFERLSLEIGYSKDTEFDKWWRLNKDKTDSSV